MNKREKWFEGKKFGIMAHYLAAPAGDTMTEDIGVKKWNDRVNSFNIKKLTEQLQKVGVDYVIFTIGQNSGYYCSPNLTYERLSGCIPGKCSQRDLIMELSEELSKKGIDLIAYLPSGAPNCDKVAMENLEWKWGYENKIGEFSGDIRKDRLISFQRKWESVIKEWSIRWGEKIKGWWIDGCYFSEQMYQFSDEPNFQSFANALRSGNSNAVVTFNTGTNTPFLIETEECDYTAGEVSTKLPVDMKCLYVDSERNDNLQTKKLHILSYLGENWGQGNPRFSLDLAAAYTKYVNEKCGIITWDVPLLYNGTLSDAWELYLYNMYKKM